MRTIHVYPRDSAMHGAIEIKTPWGWLLVFPPVMSFGKRRRWGVYHSADGTPAERHWGFGPALYRGDL